MKKVLILLFFWTSFLPFSNAQWEMVFAIDDERSISDMFVIDENNLFIIGSHNYPNIYSYVMKSVDGGVSWTDYQEFSGQYFKSIYFTSSDTGYIATNYLGGLVSILRTTSAGVNWEEISPQYLIGNVQRLPLFFYGNSGVGIMSKPGMIYKSNDYGESWTELENSNFGGFFSNLNDGVFATLSSNIVTVTKDTCSTWESELYTYLASPGAVDFKADKIFVGSTGVNGTSYGYPHYNFAIVSKADIENLLFQELHFPTITLFGSIEIVDDNEVFMGTGAQAPSRFMKSINGGQTWFTQISPQGLGMVREIDCVNSNVCYALVAPDKILKTTNGGGELQEQVITAGIGVGFDEENTSNTISIHPNPSTHTVYLSSPDITPGSFVRIYNLSGQLVYEQNVLEQSERLTIVTANIGPPGMYVVQLHNPGKVMAAQKLVVAE